jgi:hypothetical protein
LIIWLLHCKVADYLFGCATLQEDPFCLSNYKLQGFALLFKNSLKLIGIWKRHLWNLTANFNVIHAIASYFPWSCICPELLCPSVMRQYSYFFMTRVPKLAFNELQWTPLAFTNLSVVIGISINLKLLLLMYLLSEHL